jgi:hypothetical protein
LRIDWSDTALSHLEVIAARAPKQAERIIGAIERLASRPFPARCRLINYRDGSEHALSVPPHVVAYGANAGYLRVHAILDSRQRNEPW